MQEQGWVPKALCLYPDGESSVCCFSWVARARTGSDSNCLGSGAQRQRRALAVPTQTSWVRSPLPGVVSEVPPGTATARGSDLGWPFGNRALERFPSGAQWRRCSQMPPVKPLPCLQVEGSAGVFTLAVPFQLDFTSRVT